MATFSKLNSGSWRAQVRRKGKYVNDTFLRRKDAEEWALEVERRIDRGEPAIARGSRDAKTFGDLIKLHREDLQGVGKRIGRSKGVSLTFLEHRLGRLRIPELDRGWLIQFGKERASEGAGPVTVGIDLGYIKTILSHAAAVHGVVLSIEPIVLARIALGRPGLVGRGNERDRRPTHVWSQVSSSIPIRKFQSGGSSASLSDRDASGRISRIEWADFDPQKKMLLVRDRKDPRRKNGNNQRIPLLDVTG